MDWVGVDADCIGGKCPIEPMRISVSGGPGYISDNNPRNPRISAGNGGIAGTYTYQIAFRRTRFFNPNEVGLICTGSVRVSGTKRRATSGQSRRRHAKPALGLMQKPLPLMRRSKGGGY